MEALAHTLDLQEPAYTDPTRIKTTLYDLAEAAIE
jgi:hypothetical protein